MIVVTLVKQVVGVQCQLQRSLAQGYMLAKGDVERPVTACGFLWRYDVVLRSHDVGVEAHKTVAVPLEGVFALCVDGPRSRERQRVILLSARELACIQIFALQHCVPVAADVPVGLGLKSPAYHLRLVVLIELQALHIVGCGVKVDVVGKVVKVRLKLYRQVVVRPVETCVKLV